MNLISPTGWYKKFVYYSSHIFNATGTDGEQSKRNFISAITCVSPPSPYINLFAQQNLFQNLWILLHKFQSSISRDII